MKSLQFLIIAFSVQLFALSSTYALTPLETKWVKTVISANVDTDPPARRRKLDTSDVRAWIAILPNAADREHDEYIIIPWLGIITPVIYTPTSDPRYKDIVEGRNLDVNEFLKQWVHHYPGTSLPGMDGNALIGGHSNFFKNQKTDFTSIFATLPMLDSGDEVWYYKRVNSESWMRYVYIVSKSYETTPDDATVFDALGTGSELTFYTCVPIGTADNRWIIKTNLSSKQQVFYPTMIESYDNYQWYDELDAATRAQLRTLVEQWASSWQIQAFIDAETIQTGSLLSGEELADEPAVVTDVIVPQPQLHRYTRMINWIVWLFS